MKKINTRIAAMVLGGTFILSSCTAVQNANNTQKGAGIGAVAGGVIGGILGNNIGKGGNTALGAVIGAAVGGAAGGVIGNKMDKQAQKIEQVLPGAEVVRTEEGINLILDENSRVTFDYNASSLTSTAKTNLDKLIEVFKEYPDTNLLIVGHTDNKGSQSYNLPLSQKRAQSVKDYLVSKGVSSSRLTSQGKGLEEPIADNNTDQGRAQNRRVEIAITANEKMKADAAKEAGQ
ncbi:Outer membrane protein OmpA [Chishuiella changwenlii]|jgi:outer membrane protein OmpA-like peptidoglycan-associated protein|uniref:Membrane protein n=1 Tax=Chishuiella changwenlii TaxID=1434701 RepID=A0A1M6YSQ2_9FLAO|nr:OmpA family protein [Chishuiella changwenlii]GGE88379.1 membrane protein [Chishuiella changwenlii]SHL21135.1 Outer membrane protein OmpA [Chishuiella changwenlii]